MPGKTLRHTYPLIFGLAIGMLMVSSPAFADTVISLGQYDKPVGAGWKEKSFKGKTTYTVRHGAFGPCMRAESNGTSSGLFMEKHIDLTRTPFLNWSWQVDQPLDNHHETIKAGDDFSARIYLIVSDGWFFWKTRAINYVWANQQAVGSVWKNPYTSRSAMLAVESGADHAGQWQHYKRNARADLKQAFADDFTHIDAIAIMTDSDDTGLKAGACYGEIYFSEH